VRVLVTGGRTFTERDWLWAGLDLLHSMDPITEVIEGGATGADVRAQEWAHRREVHCTTVPAQWEKYGRGAGHIRNSEMARLGPDVVLACPGGPGTAGMIKIAKAQGLKVISLEKMPIAKGPESRQHDLRALAG
jgi:hypothetical protein